NYPALSEHFDLHKIAAMKPKWLRSNYYLAELLKPNSTTFWKEMITRVLPVQDKEVQEKVSVAASEISDGNKNFFGLALVGMGLAAVGKWEIPDPSTTSYSDCSIIKQKWNNTSRNAVFQAHLQFEDEATDFEELLKRLQLLY